MWILNKKKIKYLHEHDVKWNYKFKTNMKFLNKTQSAFLLDYEDLKIQWILLHKYEEKISLQKKSVE